MTFFLFFLKIFCLNEIFAVLFRRAKEKRLKKDAGRTRWSQYFRSMKGGSSPRLDKLLDKDELKVDLDSFSHGKIYELSSNRKVKNDKKWVMGSWTRYISSLPSFLHLFVYFPPLFRFYSKSKISDTFHSIPSFLSIFCPEVSESLFNLLISNFAHLATKCFFSYPTAIFII